MRATDPMESPEQAEAEAVERQDEARREQHWREAEQVMADVLAVRRVLAPRCGHLPTALDVIDAVRWGHDWVEGFTRDNLRTLQAFDSDYGTPALLRVLAKALEAQ